MTPRHDDDTASVRIHTDLVEKLTNQVFKQTAALARFETKLDNVTDQMRSVADECILRHVEKLHQRNSIRPQKPPTRFLTPKNIVSGLIGLGLLVGAAIEFFAQ